MKVSEIRELQADELETEIKKNHAALFKLRFHSEEADNQRKGDVRKLKADIARMKTILREREIEAANAEKGSNNG